MNLKNRSKCISKNIGISNIACNANLYENGQNDTNMYKTIYPNQQKFELESKTNSKKNKISKRCARIYHRKINTPCFHDYTTSNKEEKEIKAKNSNSNKHTSKTKSRQKEFQIKFSNLLKCFQKDYIPLSPNINFKIKADNTNLKENTITGYIKDDYFESTNSQIDKNEKFDKNFLTRVKLPKNQILINDVSKRSQTCKFSTISNNKYENNNNNKKDKNPKILVNTKNKVMNSKELNPSFRKNSTPGKLDSSKNEDSDDVLIGSIEIKNTSNYNSPIPKNARKEIKEQKAQTNGNNEKNLIKEKKSISPFSDLIDNCITKYFHN